MLGNSQVFPLNLRWGGECGGFCPNLYCPGLGEEAGKIRSFSPVRELDRNPQMERARFHSFRCSAKRILRVDPSSLCEIFESIQIRGQIFNFNFKFFLINGSLSEFHPEYVGHIDTETIYGMA